MAQKLSKPEPSLIYGPWIMEVAETLTHGRKKYARHQWREFDPEVYQDALWRHVIQSNDEEADDETGLSHYSHIACNAMFLWYFQAPDSGTRLCRCDHCNLPAYPAQHHSTATHLGS